MPPVEHIHSRYESILRTKKSYAFLLVPRTGGVWYRRYICLSCTSCRQLDFVKCTNTYCGKWTFCSFDVNSHTMKKLLVPYFGVKKQVFKNKKECGSAANLVIKLISKYYKMLPNPLQ